MNTKYGKLNAEKTAIGEYAPNAINNDFNAPESAYLAAGWKILHLGAPSDPAPSGMHYEQDGYDETDTDITAKWKAVEDEKVYRHFSKYSMIKMLKANGYFEAFMTLIKADELTYQLWLAAEYLDESDDVFKESVEKAKVALGVDDATVEAFLAEVEEA